MCNHSEKLIEGITTSIIESMEDSTLKNQNRLSTLKNVRPGCKDIWNAFMVENAAFGQYDIPYCPTTANVLPKRQVTWEEAKAIHKKHISNKDYDYSIDAFVNWYIDDYKFDGVRGIWHDSGNALKVLKHFAGAITPDFSTYQDFPEAMKIHATYRMRAYGYWLGTQGIAVINNVRWGTSESYKYCFEGIPHNSIVSIGTVGGGPRKLKDRRRFDAGLQAMVQCLEPHTILVYGSDRGNGFDNLRDMGIKIIHYPSRTSQYFEGRNGNE